MSARHVLVINHDQQVLDLVRDVLADEGYRVSIGRLAEETVADVARLRPDLIVLDVVVDGAEVGGPVVHRLRAGADALAVPVILCTSAVEAAHALAPHLARLGVELLAKPFTLEALVACVERNLPPRPADPDPVR